ncbi:E3 ubiquitin-protein ligase DTX4 isoform X2 [Cervus elaphus]|uniref:E3 ubiquitin-protein ligase DTX4 isoform X3 n=1 Tax=Cervus canadensis TaxID=1574408 RepID=UPI001C9E7706|nr:E3 ubiquitin-protein ligase DTX4 isoform X3 [Cervus canadensis]XP_043770271.1 E3 ubiquitin-protein ligase DTX4 isoform X2 [Cervus elaphus]
MLAAAVPGPCPGTLRPVRRNYYDPASAPGKGVVWEWENDHGSWTPYDMDVGITIQHAFEKQRPWIDLSPIGFGYVIDFGTMGQINRQTQRQRRVRRRLDLVYPLVTGAAGRAASWPAAPGVPAAAAAAGPRAPPCSCPQCVLVRSVKAAAAPPAPAARRSAAPPAAVKGPPPPAGPGATPPDSTGVGRGPGKPAPSSQTIRRQASSAVSGAAPAGCPASPPGANGKAGRAALATLNRTSLQRLALAQSRVLIASGVPTVPVKNLSGTSPVNPALAGITGILMSAAGLPVCLTRPPKLVLHPPPVSKSEIKSIPGVSNTSRKTTKKQAKKGKTPEEVLKKYLQKVRHPPDEDCTICMERLTAPSGYKGPQPTVKPDLVGKLSRCGHVYHVYCLVAMYNNGNKAWVTYGIPNLLISPGPAGIASESVIFVISSSHFLEKEMATHSSTLAWKIPWREEPLGLQSTGSQRVGHNERLHQPLIHPKVCLAFRGCPVHILLGEKKKGGRPKRKPWLRSQMTSGSKTVNLSETSFPIWKMEIEQSLLPNMLKVRRKRDRGCPGGSDGKESTYSEGRPGLDPWVRKIPWRRERLPTLVSLMLES